MVPVYGFLLTFYNYWLSLNTESIQICHKCTYVVNHFNNHYGLYDKGKAHKGSNKYLFYRYLRPLDAKKKKQETMKQDLANLRNEVVGGFAFINLIWIAINFMFQLRKPAVIKFPTAVCVFRY